LPSTVRPGDDVVKHRPGRRVRLAVVEVAGGRLGDEAPESVVPGPAPMVPDAPVDVVDVGLGDPGPRVGARAREGPQGLPDFSRHGADAVGERGAVGAVGHLVVVVVRVEAVGNPVPVAVGAPLVDLLVAVVVQAVAELGSARMDRRNRIVAIAAAGREAVAIDVEVLVHGPVAIVVDAVAGLGGRRPGGAGLRHAADAVVHRAGARRGPAGRRPQGLVHRTVAVVVHPVAGLGPGRSGRAGLRHAADAVVHRAGARAGPARRRPQGLVHRTVAVVVDAVAGLGPGRSGRAGLGHASRAAVDRAAACTDAAGDRSQPFVGRTVAVV